MGPDGVNLVANTAQLRGDPQPSKNCSWLPHHELREVPGLTGLLHGHPPARPRVTAHLCRNISLSHPFPSRHQKWPQSLHRWCLIPIWTTGVRVFKGQLLKESREWGGRGPGRMEPEVQQAGPCSAPSGDVGAGQAALFSPQRLKATGNAESQRDEDQGTVSTPGTLGFSPGPGLEPCPCTSPRGCHGSRAWSWLYERQR